MLDLSRRSLLAGVAASAAIAALPGIPGMAALGVPVETPSIPLKAFLVGTPGEYDWQSFFARSASDEDEAEVRAWLQVEGCWGVVKDDLWPRALAEVSKVPA